MSVSTLILRGVRILTRGRIRNAALQEGGAQIRRIRVSDGYSPAEPRVQAGKPIRLIFRREETAVCSERVVFPDLGVSADLPPYQDVAVDLPACEPGVHPFNCQMDMLHGNLLVEEGRHMDFRKARRTVMTDSGYHGSTGKRS